MRVVVQRVSKASVIIDGEVFGSIGKGLCVFVGINESDNTDTIRWMSNKIVNLRIFNDAEGKMNRSVIDEEGGILFISNFTLYGDARRGFRPSFTHAAPPEISEPLYNQMVDYLQTTFPVKIAPGVFGAMMDIELINDGPVTIIIEN